ncbi:hypothetical protein DB32_003294 [Sandaracinus amylolyticus]|uniref:Peptidase C-terminal archaeal/bacterial domain-containing protein n=2 Tax=Sandaracinus amylolyticus TaxID=927083 RepID=A0A0F6YJI8_9BACT|nr:hypothetical protein DB32_003294 [Sandaracinus amylolyticus]
MMKIRSVVMALGCVGLAACSGGSDSASAAVTLSGPGFAATTLRGTAGGPQAGSALGGDCIGQFPTSAQHTVTVGAAIPMLRVLVNGGPEADTTLAVRRPDGTVVCNDDSGDPGNSLNPIVEIANAAPGQYQVYVGGYSTGDTWASYTLGFSEQAGQYPSQVVAAP